jgi:hypothetical protein
VNTAEADELNAKPPRFAKPPPSLCELWRICYGQDLSLIILHVTAICALSLRSEKNRKGAKDAEKKKISFLCGLCAFAVQFLAPFHFHKYSDLSAYPPHRISRNRQQAFLIKPMQP